MNLAAILHRPTEDFIYPIGREGVTIELSTARVDRENVTLVYWPRYETDPAKRKRVRLTPYLKDAYHNYYRITVQQKPIVAYLRYCFLFGSGQQTIRYGCSGFTPDDSASDDNFFEFLWPNPTDCDNAPDWAESRIYYQIFPERFCCGDASLSPKDAKPWGTPPDRENFMGGDLRGILSKLDHIRSLGVTCLYLTPIFNAPSNHKYDTVDYFEIDPHFGTKDDLRALVEGVHQRGMKILLDGVFNHCGYYWPYFQDVVKNGEASPYSGWFFPQSYPISLDDCNYDCVGHYKWMPKINLANPEAEKYFISVGTYWVKEFHIDGWRLDVADEVPTRFWTAFSTALKRLKPDILLLGETWGDAKRLVSADRLDTAMNYLFRNAAVDWLAQERIAPSQVDHLLNRMLALYPDGVNARMYNPLDSHDTARFRFLCKQKAHHKVAVALQMTFPGSPAVYYGDEVGVTGDNDPDCRRCMEWDEEKQDREMLSWYRTLIAIRQGSGSLRTGRFQTAFYDDSANVYAFYRISREEISLIVLNAGDKAYQKEFPAEYGQGGWRELFPSQSVSPEGIQVEANSVGIYQRGI